MRFRGSGSSTFAGLVLLLFARTASAQFSYPQTITFSPLSDMALGSASFSVYATATSGDTVLFDASPPTVCTINIATVTLVAVGQCSITASQPGDAYYSAADPVTQTFNVTPASTTGGSPPPPPSPTVQSVVNAASEAPAVLPPDSYASVYGTNLAAQTGDPSTAVVLKDASGNQASASLTYAGTAQVNFVVPEGLVSGAGTLAVTDSAGASTAFPITLGTLAPGLFTVDAAGTMPAAQFLIVAADGTQTIQTLASCSGTPMTCANTPIPLAAGTQVYLILYGTGIRGRSSLKNVSVSLGGTQGSLTYAGAQGGFPGLDQVDLQVPSSLAGSGSVGLKLTADGVASNTVQVIFQ